MPVPVRPKNPGAAYGDETIRIATAAGGWDFHRRTTGWGWAELIDSEGVLLAVLDHLGELKLRDSAIPVRLEADEVDRTQRDGVEVLSLQVQAVSVAEALRGTSFDSWIGSPYDGPLMSGTVEITIEPQTGAVSLTWALTAHFDIQVEYLRGPWLRVGEHRDADRADALLPGVEWTVGDEWTSGSDWFRDPWAAQSTPHPHTVGVPIMAVNTAGTTISLEWDPGAAVTGWFTMPRECAQPVLAAPNFIERRPGSLLGLMIPQTRQPDAGGWQPAAPMELHRGQRLDLAARIHVTNGRGLDAVVDWVRRHGFPPPPEPRWPLDETLHRIADAYATHLWHPGLGFGTGQTEDVRLVVPRFVHAYLERFPDSPQAGLLREHAAQCAEAEPPTRDDLAREGQELLGHQQEDGSYCFDPEGRHYRKDDFLVARDLVAPMGQAGDTGLDLSMTAAIRLFELASATGDESFTDGALRALDACLDLYRPEGGDFWETPLHAPNLFAAGHGAVAYALGHRLTGDERYADRVRHWLRSLLGFTHLWEPAGSPMLYNTKPCLCSSDWYFAHWVRDHVQWEVLESFALADAHDLDLAAFDPELDWSTYRAGVTWAGVRWLIDHRTDNWRPHNVPASLDAYREGRLDLCLPDTHNATTGLYGGMAIPPGTLGLNLLAL